MPGLNIVPARRQLCCFTWGLIGPFRRAVRSESIIPHYVKAGGERAVVLQKTSGEFFLPPLDFGMGREFLPSKNTSFIGRSAALIAY